MSTHNICFYKKKNQQKKQHKNIIQASFDEPLADLFLFIHCHMIVVGYYGFTLVVRVSLCQYIYHSSIPPSLFLFPDDNLSEYQWIFTKLGVFIHNVEGVVGCCKGVVCLMSLGQLILAYSWARPAVLVAVKEEWENFHFFSFFPFIPVPLSSLSLSFISSTIFSVFFLPFSGRRHKWPTRIDVSLNPNTVNQS